MKKMIALILLLTLSTALVACENFEKEPASSSNNLNDIYSMLNSAEKSTNSLTSTNSSTTSETDKINTSATVTDEIRPEFRKAMDDLESFYDDYCEFMKQYQANPTDMTLLSKYASMAAKLIEMNEEMENWEGEDMNDAEAKYYLEVTNRITQKLLEVSQ